MAPSSPSIARPADVEVRRSARRRRTATAFREAGRTVVLLPAGLSAADEANLVAKVVRRLEAGERRRGTDLDLDSRARRLSVRYLGGHARPTSVRWVTNQRTRWGSCTPTDGTIRLSHELQGMPAWVIDYVILHELAHLLVPGHGPAFWSHLAAYPQTERARGFLQGVVHGAGRGAGAGAGARDGGWDEELEDHHGGASRSGDGAPPSEPHADRPRQDWAAREPRREPISDGALF